jgi:hypothetical protein
MAWRKERGSTRLEPLRPTFLVVGASKARTTSLYEYLKQHPDVFMPASKEPCYFINSRYGLETFDSYLRLFDGARPDQARGESSTAYLSCPESAAWIRSELGPIKIIVILRNPAHRAFSLYGWMVREGYEHATTFAEGLALEAERRTDPDFSENPPQFLDDYMYFSTGLYTTQVTRYFEQFGRDRVLVLLFEEFVKDPTLTCRTVFEFLGVDATFTPHVARHNEGKRPRSIRAQYVFRNSHRLAPWLRPEGLRRKLSEIGLALNVHLGPKAKAKLPDEEYRALLRQYDADIRALEALLERELSAWRAPDREGAPAGKAR